MTTIGEHAVDWESQREILSAFLDGRLAVEEGGALRQHVKTCARCRTELADLQQVVTLLRALPQPVAPRSFALPLPERVGTPSAPDLAPGRPSRHRGTRWPQVAQWAGGLVAAAGLLVGIAGSFGPVQHATQALAPAASGAYAPRQTARTPQNAAADTANRAATATHQVAFGADVTATPALAPTPTAARFPSVPPGYEAPIPDAPVIGATLLLVGAATFAVGTGSRRRRR
jgi:anti-sigma factor RsiW